MPTPAKPKRRRAETNPMAKLKRTTISRRTVDRLKADKDTVFWDSELLGFGVRVYPTGRKVYVVQTRAGGRNGTRVTVGRHGVILPEEARQSSDTSHIRESAAGRGRCATGCHTPETAAESPRTVASNERAAGSIRFRTASHRDPPRTADSCNGATSQNASRARRHLVAIVRGTGPPHPRCALRAPTFSSINQRIEAFQTEISINCRSRWLRAPASKRAPDLCRGSFRAVPPVRKTLE